jgi:putative transposase
MIKNHNLAQSLSDISISRFYNVLKYKCEWRGINLIQINRFDPSSKKCSSCGIINKELKLSEREWTCTCGIKHDRDLNAAINIKQMGLLKHSGQELSVEPVELSTIVEAKKQEG